MIKVGLNRLALAGIFVFASGSVNAAVIDNGYYTSDTVSGLDWLDVTISSNQSFNYVSSQFGVGQEYEGWRYATSLEFNDLIGSFGSTPPSGPARYILIEVNNYSAADVLVALLGSTTDVRFMHEYGMTYDALNGKSEGEYYDGTLGLLADEGWAPDRRVTALISDNDKTASSEDASDAYNSAVLMDGTGHGLGSFLVRESNSVPAPATLSLRGLGLLGLLFNRKQKRIS